MRAGRSEERNHGLRRRKLHQASEMERVCLRRGGRIQNNFLFSEERRHKINNTRRENVKSHLEIIWWKLENRSFRKGLTWRENDGTITQSWHLGPERTGSRTEEGTVLVWSALTEHQRLHNSQGTGIPCSLFWWQRAQEEGLGRPDSCWGLVLFASRWQLAVLSPHTRREEGADDLSSRQSPIKSTINKVILKPLLCDTAMWQLTQDGETVAKTVTEQENWGRRVYKSE